ncbi:ABC transporter ATP-binding protein [Caproicibacterium sp. BJN0003]|uniref:ABC transporter ATP-binding protein n=1 Tax=Caproicibacterium sp. BJN0003 TaxID=2994078 RepID=UPI00224F47C3|nr:ABC transporter ATP-binding protein [Caproicibacterium sp. BJN0003]UZT81124.1 ABC transporter ATP-binding protein [Caproicibacterium sp. BJN0003]
MENDLEIRSLNKSFQSGFALKDINLTLPRGSVMGFIGQNGAGKTTTIKCILNLLHPDSGTIRIFGKEIAQNEIEVKENIGVVFDECPLHETLSAEKAEKILSKIYQNWDSSLYQSYLKEFKLPPKRPIKEYSRGMKMKLSITCALAHHPKLLLLDEATSGLDPVVRDEILEIFYNFIQDESHSILMSSHITSDLEKIADYITFIHHGKILFSSPKDQILDSFGILKCGKQNFEMLDPSEYISYRENNFGYEILVKDRYLSKKKHPDMVLDRVNLDEIMVFFVKGEK